jgi:ATP-dependent Clp protease ATP-binding subunit ClpA
MYERFTDRGRKVIYLANQAAQRYGHEYIGTEHLLLALVEEGGGGAASVLKNLGVECREVRAELERLIQPGPHFGSQKRRLTPRAESAIRYAIEEAANSRHDVGTDHILVGLLREQEGVAAQVLLNNGLRLQEVREEVVRLLDIRSTAIRRMSSKSILIEDLPDDLTTALDGLDAEIARMNSQKEQAVADQDFEHAAQLRDEADRLKRARKAMRSEWMAKRPIDRSWLSANEGAVVELARRINEERSWDRLPALADALEATGCSDRAILDHCRQAGNHSDHCWVVELLLANTPCDASRRRSD